MNILFVTDSLFCIDRKNGGKQGSARNRDCLAAAVDGTVYTMFITFAEHKGIRLNENEFTVQGPRNKVESMLNYMRGYALVTPQVEKAVLAFIAEKDIDLVFFDSSVYGRLVKKVAERTRAKSICYMHNVEAYYALNRVKNESRLYYPMYRAFALNEALSVRYADYLIGINERDAAQTEREYGRRPDRILSVTFQDRLQDEDLVERTERKERVELLFLGSRFLPNEQGIRWFVREVMPHVPARLTVVGSGMEDLRDELTRDNVNVVGGVDDLAPYFLESDAMVLPIFSGSGMKVKTAESMMYGKVIFASDEALEGYEPIPGKIMRCNTKEEFIREIEDYRARGVTKYSAEVRQRFKAGYSNDSARAALADTVQSLFPEAKVRREEPLK